VGRYAVTCGIVGAVLAGIQFAGVSPLLVVGLALAAFGIGLLIWSVETAERLRASSVPVFEPIVVDLDHAFPVERRR